jgi:acyl-coenzyme A thioesterase PaaI-like protein
MQLPYTKNCFVCGEHNHHGLHLRFRRVGEEVHADFTPALHHAGFRDMAHGGILGTVLDEAMFWAAASQTKRFCVAAELNVRFLKRVSVGQKLLVVAKLEQNKGRLWHSSAELRDAAGVVYARATCKQMPISVADMKHMAEDFLADAGTVDAASLFPELAP